MGPDYAAMAERMWPDFVRWMLIGAAATWGLAMAVLVVVEVVRLREMDAALRTLGVTTHRLRLRRPARREAPREERPSRRGGAPAGGSPAGVEAARAAGMDAAPPARSGGWARGG